MSLNGVGYTMNGKKKGFIFTLLTVLLVSLLISLALFKLPSSYNVDVAEKVVYTWDDVREDLLSLTGLTVVKQDANITMYDQLPPTAPVVQSLQAYNNFIQNYYREQALEIQIQDTSGNPITDFSCFGKTDCSQSKVVFTIKPFNITYEYPDWSKNQLDLRCPSPSYPSCDFSAVQRLNFTFNFTSISFSCIPNVWNNCTSSDIDWGQYAKVFGPGACTGNEPCMLKPYNLTLIDSQNKVYSCPGNYGDNTGNTKGTNCPETLLNWLDPDKATLVVKSSPCWLKLSFGSGGDFNIKSTGPNNEDPCLFNVSSTVNLQFNTTDFSIDIPALLHVHDLAWNSSKTQRI